MIEKEKQVIKQTDNLILDMGPKDTLEKAKEDKMKIVFLLKFDISTPLGIMYLSAMLKKNNYQPYIVCFNEKDYIKQLKELKPDVIMYSITTGNHKEFIEINKKVKKYIKVYSIFGGPHPTFYPKMVEEEGVDAVCRGEGEYAIVDFLDKMKKGEEHKTLNFWVKKDNKIFKNKLRPLIDNLDDIPFPDREIVNEKEPFFAQLEMKRFLTSRGCPFQCTYCFNKKYNALYLGNGKMLRRRSVDNVIQEIKQVRGRYVMKAVKFVDDTFNLNEDWLKEFCYKYKREINLPFICNIRADLVKGDMIKNMSDANCVAVYMAIETGNEKIRKEILGRNMSNEQIINACRLLKKYNIKIVTQNMLGIPSETLEQEYETIYLNSKCRPERAEFSILQPYPDTELSKYAIENNYFDGNYDSIDPQYLHYTPLNYSPKEKNKIENLAKLSTMISTHGFLIPISKLLIQFPKNRLYDAIYKFFYATSLWRIYSDVFGYNFGTVKYMIKINNFIKEK